MGVGAKGGTTPICCVVWACVGLRGLILSGRDQDEPQVVTVETGDGQVDWRLVGVWKEITI